MDVNNCIENNSHFINWGISGGTFKYFPKISSKRRNALNTNREKKIRSAVKRLLVEQEFGCLKIFFGNEQAIQQFFFLNCYFLNAGCRAGVSALAQ